MEESRMKNAMRFYLLATQLKYKIRKGWDEQHWNVKKERLESVAEHIYGTCILAISLDSEFKCNIDLYKVDITPFDNVSPEEKMQKEHEAFAKLVGDLVKKDEIISLFLEFDSKQTREAVFAYHCDKLEADMQAKVYQDMGCQNPLEDQKNNVVFKSAKTQQMIADGAKTAFDIWYEYDKKLYEDDETFAQMLEYVRSHSTDVGTMQ